MPTIDKGRVKSGTGSVSFVPGSNTGNNNISTGTVGNTSSSSSGIPGPQGPEGPIGLTGPRGQAGYTVVFSSTLDITPLQVSTLYSQPMLFDIELPGPGKILNPISCTIQCKVGLAKYIPTGWFYVDWEGTDYGQLEINIGQNMDYNTDFICFGFQEVYRSFQNLSSIVNTPLMFVAGNPPGAWGQIASYSIDNTIGNSAGGWSYVVGDTGVINSALSDETYTVTAINPGGTRYSVGDTGIIDGGSFDATYIVNSVNGNGSVLTYTITGSGSNYTINNKSRTGQAGIQPGNGVGLTLDILSINSGGSGYVVGDTGYIAGGNNNSTYIIDTVDGNGSVLTFTITDSGSLYNDTQLYAQTINSGGQPGIGIQFYVNYIGDSGGIVSCILSTMGSISSSILSATGGTVTAATISGTGYDYASGGGWSTTPTTGVGLGLVFDLTVDVPSNGSLKVDLLYQIIDAIV